MGRHSTGPNPGQPQRALLSALGTAEAMRGVALALDFGDEPTISRRVEHEVEQLRLIAFEPDRAESASDQMHRHLERLDALLSQCVAHAEQMCSAIADEIALYEEGSAERDPAIPSPSAVLALGRRLGEVARDRD